MEEHHATDVRVRSSNLFRFVSKLAEVRTFDLLSLFFYCKFRIKILPRKDRGRGNVRHPGPVGGVSRDSGKGGGLRGILGMK